MKSVPSIAIVVQRYGAEVNGGAELHARWLAEHLQRLGEVHVLTTCAIDYLTWRNEYEPGESTLNGVTVHRFPVDAPRSPQLDRQTIALFHSNHTYFDELQWMKDQGPYSSGLLTFIQATRRRFDLFIFVTYLYPTTYFGLPLVSDKAVLVPTAHDEPYLRLPLMRPLFHLPQVIVYNTEPERLLVERVMQNQHVPQVVAGVGINVPPATSADRFRQKYGIEGDFLLYVGRIDASKNVPELFDFFERYRTAVQRDVKLVLIGKAAVEIPQRPDIVHLGFLPEEDKFDAIAATAVLVQPSLYESLSMVALEAWLLRKPVLLNGRCEVLKHQCRASNGGLYYHSYDEFELTLNRLLDDPSLRHRLGQQGRRFVRSRYDWDIIVAKYQAILDTLTGQVLTAAG